MPHDGGLFARQATGDPLLPHVDGMSFVAFLEQAAIRLLRKQSFDAETSRGNADPAYCIVERIEVS